ncbi:MAG: alpha-amylase family glycosyl hydrolase [Pirellulales bacterium]
MATVLEEVQNLPLGAQLLEKGASFCIWAPHAERVTVVGTFNDWNGESHPLVRNANGTWEGVVPEAKPGDEYRLMITHGDRTWSRIDPRARQVTNSVGNAVLYRDDFDWGADAFQLPPWNELVIYELHIGTFGGEDGVNNFDKAIERLDYLRDLGINAIELMPLAEFAGDYSWGYNPAHPFAVETAYGGPSGLKRFVKAAHERGIGVIIDVVYNHFGPSDLDLWQFDGWSENGKGGIYFFNDWRSATPWGDTRPDYGRGEVRQYIFDNAMMWLSEYRADGLRYDMTLYMRSVDGDESKSIPEGFSLAQWINTEVEKRYPGRIVIAEDLRNNALLTAKCDQGGAHFGAQWAADFVHPIRQAIIEIDDSHRSMQAVREAIEIRYNEDSFQRVLYTESHDEVANGKQRVVSEIDPSDEPGRYAIKRSTLGAAVLMTAPGIPMLFQGQEFLRDKWFMDTRPLDWDRSEKYEGIVQLYRDLIELRRNRKGLTKGLTGQHGHVVHLDDIGKVLVLHRWFESGIHDCTVVVYHFAGGRKEHYRIPWPSSGKWDLLFNSDSRLYHPWLDDTVVQGIETEATPMNGFENSQEISMGAYSCLIFGKRAT